MQMVSTILPQLPNQCGLYVQFGSSAHMASGNLAHSQELFATKGNALSLAMALYYNSLDPANGATGWGWSHSYDKSLVRNSDGSALLKEGNWQRRLYTFANGAYVSRSGDYSSLVENSGGGFILTEKNGTAYQFAADGKIQAASDLNGNTISAYTDGNLTTITDPVGRSAILTYDASNHLASLTDPAGGSYTFSYSGTMLSSVTYPNGGRWNYTYDTNAFMLSKTDPLGNLTTYGYDANHRIVSSVSPGGNTRSIGYPQEIGTTSGAISTSSFTEKDGGVWQYAYDTLTGTLTQSTDPQGSSTSYTYDVDGNRTSITGPSGAKTSYAYDSQGNVTSVTDATGQTVTNTYDSFGQVMSTTAPQGNATSYTYDANGNMASITDAAGATTQYQHDDRGNVVKVIDAAGQATSFTYDDRGNIASVTDPTGARSSTTHDDNGNVLAQTDTAGKTTTYTYDSQNHPLSVTDPLGNITKYTYDLKGNKTSQTDANGNVTQYGYDDQDHLVTTVDALGNATTYAYGATGCASCGGGADKLTSLTDAKGQTTSFQYDLLGRLTQETDSVGKSTSYLYDAVGNLISKTDANGGTIAFSYDAEKRLTKTIYPDGSAQSYAYDPVGRILAATNSNVGYTYAYDAAGRVTSVADSRGYTIAYLYDLVGNRKKMTVQPSSPDERIISYAYDVAGRLTGITSNAGTFTYAYGALGRRSSLAYPNRITASYSYDSAGRLISLNHGSVVSFVYTTDKIGNRTSKTFTEAEQYLYDAIYQLLTVTSGKPESFSFDRAGNRVSGPGAKDIAYLYNPANQMKHGRKLQYGYDNNGNQITKTVPGVTDKRWSQTWDYENRLVKVEKVKGAEKKTVSFNYDPQGRRVGKQVMTVIDGTTKLQTFVYVYDNDNIVLEIMTDGSGTIKTFFTHGPEVDEHLAMERDGQFSYYHADGLGSVVALSDQSGKTVASYEYDSYGMVKPSSNVLVNSYTYAGRERDKETGLYYNRARYYDPMEGRFITKDPVGYKGGVNVYANVENNPINKADSDGLGYDKKTIEKWEAIFNKYKDLYKECSCGLDDIGQCTTCCKKIVQGMPGLSSDASAWWIPNNMCVAIICVPKTQ